MTTAIRTGGAERRWVSANPLSRRKVLASSAATFAAGALGNTFGVADTTRAKSYAVGDFSVTVLSDGHLVVPSAFLARNAPRQELEEPFLAHDGHLRRWGETVRCPRVKRTRSSLRSWYACLYRLLIGGDEDAPVEITAARIQVTSPSRLLARHGGGRRAPRNVESDRVSEREELDLDCTERGTQVAQFSGPQVLGQGVLRFDDRAG